MPVEDVEVIEILLHEYDGMRSEILSRHGGMFLSISTVATTLFGLLGFYFTHEVTLDIWLGLSLFALILFVLSLMWLDYDAFTASRRLRTIASRINLMAGRDLLVEEFGASGGLGGFLLKFLLWTRNWPT